MICIRFCTGNDLVSDTIRAWQRDGWATHCEAVLPDRSLLGAHLEGGVAIRAAGYDKATTTRDLIVALDCTDWITKPFYEWLNTQVGKPYDTTAIAGIATGRDWREPDSWFCSELMAAALEACGYFPKLSSVTNHVSPRDLLLLLSGRELIPDAA